MDRRHGAGHAQLVAQFRQRQVGLPGDQRRQLVAVGGQQPGFASSEVVARANLAGAPPLLQQLLHHA